MINYWIIPIFAFIIGVLITGGSIYEKYTVVIPKADAELLELMAMSCNEIKTRNSMGSYALRVNGVFAREKVDACSDAEDAIKQFEREKMNRLLADPNSQESLTKRLSILFELRESHFDLLSGHVNQTKILQGNLTNFDMEMNHITQTMIELGYGDTNDGCTKIQIDYDNWMVVCD